jgi:hypothetical protein
MSAAARWMSMLGQLTTLRAEVLAHRLAQVGRQKLRGRK